MKLETAKALKEAGWNKETEKWYWSENTPCPNHEQGQGCYLCDDTGMVFLRWFISDKKNISNTSTKIYIKAYPCPSLEELLAEMPETIMINGEAWRFSIAKQDGLYMAMYVYYDTKKKTQTTRPSRVYIAPDPCEAVANLYLKLKQEGIIK